MASNEKEIINKFINVLWRWIKQWDAPAQTDGELWLAFQKSEQKMIDDFCEQYTVTEDLRLMFVKMANDYVEYCGRVSMKGE